MNSKRIFLAIELPEHVIQGAEKVKKEIESTGEDIKLVDKRNFHINVFFFGTVSDDMLEAIKTAVTSTVRSFHTFDITVKGSGVFLNEKSPRVLWLGVESPELIFFQAELKKKFAGLGFNTGEKKYKPHITLGRVRSFKNKSSFLTILKKYTSHVFGTFKSDKIVLFESTLSPDGPEYKKVLEFKIGD